MTAALIFIPAPIVLIDSGTSIAEPSTALAKSTPTPKATPIPGIEKQPGCLESSTVLGAAHIRVKDGFVWRKTPDGEFWITVKRTDGSAMGNSVKEAVKAVPFGSGDIV